MSMYTSSVALCYDVVTETRFVILFPIDTDICVKRNVQKKINKSHQNHIKITNLLFHFRLKTLYFKLFHFNIWLCYDIRTFCFIWSFIENGSQIIETSSYQLSVENLCRLNGYSVEEARETIKDSFRVADEARQESKQENVLIAGSIGPYGATLCDGSEFNGSYAESMSEEVSTKVACTFFVSTVIFEHDVFKLSNNLNTIQVKIILIVLGAVIFTFFRILGCLLTP